MRGRGSVTTQHILPAVKLFLFRQRWCVIACQDRGLAHNFTHHWGREDLPHQNIIRVLWFCTLTVQCSRGLTKSKIRIGCCFSCKLTSVSCIPFHQSFIWLGSYACRCYSCSKHFERSCELLRLNLMLTSCYKLCSISCLTLRKVCAKTTTNECTDCVKSVQKLCKNNA